MASFTGRRIKLLIVLVLLCFIGSAQFKKFTIRDKHTNEPLAYATVLLLNENKVLYTDSTGILYLEEKIIQQNDSIRINFINYKECILTGKILITKDLIELERSFNNLKEVIIGECKEDQVIRITNKYGLIQSSNGAGFDIPVKLLGYYPNETGKEGWLTQLDFYASSVKQTDAKLRIHWYEWNEAKQEPGRDITDTSIIVSVYKNGWNAINIPDHRIYIGEKGIVLGFDMIYTSEIFKSYGEIKNDIESRTFRFKYNWFLGADFTTKKEGFHLLKDQFISPSRFLKEKKYHKPAIHLYIKTCGEKEQ